MIKKTISGLDNTIKREWAPSSCFILHDDVVKTTVHFSPTVLSRNRTGKFAFTFSLFGANPLKPVWVYRSKQISLFETISLDSDSIAKESGITTLQHYAEIYSPSVTFAPPDDNIVLVSYLHYTSRDGSVAGHIPSAYIYGASRFTKKGVYNYENFPGVRLDERFSLLVYTINPFARLSRYWVLLIGANGQTIEDGPYVVRGKQVHVWDSNQIRQKPPPAVCGMVIKSEMKTSSFVGTRSLINGTMVSFDHMHPFFSRVQ